MPQLVTVKPQDKIMKSPSPVEVVPIKMKTETVMEYMSDDPYPSMNPAVLRKLLLPTPIKESLSSLTINTPEVFSNDDSNSVVTTRPTVKRSLLDECSASAQALRRKLLHGTNLLIVQGGFIDKLPVYERLFSLGVKVYILDSVSSCWTEIAEREDSPLTAFIPIDDVDTDNKSDGDANKTLTQHMVDSVNKWMSKKTVIPFHFHAVLTYFEDATVLAASVAAALGVSGCDIQACEAARSKYRTRQMMAQANLPTPKFVSLCNESEIDDAMSYVGFPAILKPAFGAASIGVTRVDNESELRVAYTKLCEQIETDGDPLWLQGKDIVYEEYYDGDEFDVDILLCDGKAVYAKISDNWAVREPWFQETGMHAPCSYEIEKQEEIRQLAIDAAIALGFEFGCLHVECRYTSHGARIIEVNGRMGGDPVYDFNRLVWGVDLVEEHFMSVLGIPIHPPMNKVANCAIAEFAFNAPCSGTIIKNDWLHFLLDDDEVIRVKYFKKIGDKVVGPEDGVPDWIAEIIVVRKGSSPKDVNQKIREIVTNQCVVPIKPKRESERGRKLSFFFPSNAYPFA